ncbi:glycosyltransferase family 4 protein [Nocardioides sp.]|uniref:glycosyltransferase family 4 protein n=1 Tax=Nocardioides sp. TaxID=35761 RepID=UPI0035690EC9
MRGLPAFLEGRGWDVTVVAGGPGEGQPVHVLPMVRRPAPLADLTALARWVRLIRRSRPAVVVAGTPKAGLLGMVAARLSGVERRVYLLRGLRLETARGPLRWLLVAMERLAAWCATEVVCVSPSLRDAFVGLRLGDPRKALVLGAGSSNGVDTERFRPATSAERQASRAHLGIDQSVSVVGFIGRLTPDKGLDTLVAAAGLARREVDFHLLLIGREEEAGYRDRLAEHLAEAGVEHSFVDEMPDIERGYAAMDVFCLPSRREGFPNVSLEAAACQLPVISTDATGSRDAVRSGVSGLLVPMDDPPVLAQAITRALADPAGSRAMGAAGRAWMLEEFDRPLVWARLDDFLVRGRQTAQ